MKFLLINLLFLVIFFPAKSSELGGNELLMEPLESKAIYEEKSESTTKAKVKGKKATKPRTEDVDKKTKKIKVKGKKATKPKKDKKEKN
tara:strand:+ start:1297 stop:1563 length:267 start_codon:yes stop_codon:yes gene_type:complete